MTPSEIPTYTEGEVRERLAAELPAWEYDGGWIKREIPTRSRARALMAASLVAHLSEAARHHPDLELRRDGLLIRVRHHWAAGITDADFALARALEDALG